MIMCSYLYFVLIYSYYILWLVYLNCVRYEIIPKCVFVSLYVPLLYASYGFSLY